MGDWGTSQWDVDLKADALHKSLFGAKKKSDVYMVKADVITEDGDGKSFRADSDDDGNEKFSKKAKKKLKERNRKENKRNKKKNGEDTGNVSKPQDLPKEKKGKESKITKANKTQKQTENSKNAKLFSETKRSVELVKVKVSEPSLQNNGVKKGNRRRKRKSAAIEENAGAIKVKSLKSEDGKSESGKEGKQTADAEVAVEGEPKKKRKRIKKKKPNSKRNKYKHLGLKSKSDNCNSEDGDSKGIIPSPEKNSNVETVKLNKGKKRKNSESTENIQAKKSKLEDKSNTRVNSTIKLKKKKKDNKPELNGEKKAGCDKGDENESKKPIEMGNSKSKKALKKAKKDKKSQEKNNRDGQNDSKIAPQVSVSPFSSSQGSELQQRMMSKLSSARFRFINEQLYTIRGNEAFRMFQNDKTLMDAYNTGFQGQAKDWSVNPLDVIIKQLKTKSDKLMVADFGCGEARLSASVPQKVHSFDLFALNERVTVCDMSKTPLANDSVDVVVFCLSLMGTNLNDYLLEANRILKEGSFLKIAEVQSRFHNPNHFINAVSSIGFKAVNTRELSKMFYLMDFKKVKKMSKASKQIKDVSLNPCLYKKR